MPITQFSPDTLRSNITDFAKGGRYNVEIIPPTAIGLDLGVASQLRYTCESASLPTRSLASQPQDIHGPPREIPYRAEPSICFLTPSGLTAVPTSMDTVIFLTSTSPELGSTLTSATQAVHVGEPLS